MREWLRSAPWFLVSLTFHLIVAVILMNVEWRTIETDESMILEATYEHDEIEPLLEDPLSKEEELFEVEEIEEILEEPVVTEEYIEENVEEEFENTLEPIDAPFETRDINDVIGIGGGGGGDRFFGKYRRRASSRGGHRATQKAIALGLDWLKRHQDPDGFWDCDGFDMQCTDSRCSGRGQALNDVGVTGLALLAFMGSGNTITSGPHRATVKKGIKYLCDVQDPSDGCMVLKEGMQWMYNHALATLALTEAYGLSNFPIIKKPAQRAIDFIHKSKNPGRAWRYNNGEVDPMEQNDVSVTGWMVMCLASARDFGLKIYEQDIIDALRYIDDMTDSTSGRTGYKERGSYSAREIGDDDIWPADQTEAMTAVAMLCRVFAGSILGEMESQISALEKGADLLTAIPPEWNEEKGCIDYYYWYYGSYAMYQMAGSYWRDWKRDMEDAVVDNQLREGCERGSWPPQQDPWGDNGGRVYSTALLTLCLEVYYRYDDILGARSSSLANGSSY
jgi:hypothetical protein